MLDASNPKFNFKFMKLLILSLYLSYFPQYVLAYTTSSDGLTCFDAADSPEKIVTHLMMV
jgi:hypothetical protein